MINLSNNRITECLWFEGIFFPKNLKLLVLYLAHFLTPTFSYRCITIVQIFLDSLQMWKMSHTFNGPKKFTLFGLLVIFCAFSFFISSIVRFFIHLCLYSWAMLAAIVSVLDLSSLIYINP